MRRYEFVDRVRQDLLFALRQLGKNPTFTIVALLTLALGIGATTSIFSVVYSVLLKPLPYANSDRIVTLQESGNRGPYGNVTFGNWNDWRTRSTSFEAIGASWGSAPLTLTGVGDPTPIQTGLASADFWKAIYGWTSQLKIQFIVYDSLQGNVCGSGIGKQHKERRFVFIGRIEPRSAHQSVRR